ncbi:MAG TPA: triose-phosphate isomerase family protein [Microbacterium sp.]|uniref:triose-phosphate isomerase family protein n=1 Tax=Microbacterium sp. TaxID=51671 RepID=UPI002B4A304F|nr:triose-phosphate isomerase family protein [Microbacterium sp.]HKT58139.1 triose-phosphate isomerase family protein [Microbacterium sp.]
MRRVMVGVSLKAYFGRAGARAWFDRVAAVLRHHPALRDPAIDVFVIPTYLQLDDARAALDALGIAVGAQDVSEFGAGAYTGEVTAAELAESGVALAEVGHAERRRLFGETDEVTAAKVAASVAAGLVPVLCVGETEQQDAASAAPATVAQLRRALACAPAGRIVVAYEPVWAIGAAAPAPVGHLVAVTRALTAALAEDPDREGSLVIYGGSAGPGLLTRLGDDVDGLFLGRFAHDPANLAAVLDEAVVLAAARRAREAVS